MILSTHSLIKGQCFDSYTGEVGTALSSPELQSPKQREEQWWKRFGLGAMGNMSTCISDIGVDRASWAKHKLRPSS